MTQNEIAVLSIVPGWIAALGLMASQVAYFNRWIGRQETIGKENRTIADKAHIRIDLMEEREEHCKQAVQAFQSDVVADIAEIKTDIKWIKEKLEKYEP